MDQFFFVLLLLAFFLESVCLGILYINDSLKGKDKNLFLEEHILTKPFASNPTDPDPNPVPGKNFLGHLTAPNSKGWAQYLVADALLGWRLGQNISTYYHVHVHTKEYLYITDSNGFSVDVDDPPVAPQKSANIYRIIVLGGSTVMGEGAPRPSQNLVSMLREGVRERELSGPNGRRVEFINAGVEGYNSAQEYLYFVSDLLRFTPDLVIVYDGWNDDYLINENVSPFRTNTHREITRRAIQSYEETVVSAAGNLVRATEILYSNFKLGMIELPERVFTRVFSYLWSNTEAEYSTSASFSTPNPPFDPRGIVYYRIIRRAFLDLADRLSVALFLQPLVGTDDRALSDEEKASWWYPNFKLESRIAFYKYARRVLADLKEEEHGQGRACIADISDSLKGVSETVYADSGHLLPTGNKVVAARMLDELLSCGFLEKHRG
jgi:hypothetical protein